MDNRMTIARKQKWEGKQLYGRFKRLINNISHEKTWTWLRKGNFKRETESLLIAAQDNAVRTNHIKAGMDNAQQNSKCRLSSDRDETINHIISDGTAVRVFANGPGDLGSIPGRVIPKTLKMELDTTLLNTQHYKVRFKGKVEQSREWSSALPYTLV